MQRAILEVQWGPLHGTKKVLEPGTTLRVGRHEPAQLVVADGQMSAVHFELTWDGSTCTLRDLVSLKGTYVAGELVKEAVLTNGAWIRAGMSDFLVFFEAATPRPYDFDEELLEADEEDVKPEAAQWLRQERAKLKAKAQARAARGASALEALRAIQEPLYAVLDTARSDRILTLLRESVEPYRSLYEGVEGSALAHVAPYLVALPQGSSLLRRIVEEGWERRWGIFIRCPASFKEVRQHLRRLLIVIDADTRERFYYRFYDPVAMHSFMQVATTRQRDELFGPIVSFHAESEYGKLTPFYAPSALPPAPPGTKVS